MSRIRTIVLYVLPVTAFIAVFAMVFHALDYTRQVDVQHIEYAFRFLKSLHDGVPTEYLLHPQKYPLLTVLPLSFLYGLTFIGLRLTGALPSFGEADIHAYLFTVPAEIHLVTRLLVLVSALLLCVLVYRSCRKVASQTNPLSAVLLLLSSMLFLTFSSSMRPHVPVTTLTVAAFYFSLLFSETKSRKHEILAFGSAVAAFCVLQNGIFAFIFPVWATVFENGTFNRRTLKSPRLWVWLVTSGILILLVGYPFLVKQLLFDRIFDPGLGNEAIGQTPWNPQGFVVLTRTLLGSETFLFLFGVLGFIRFKQGKNALHPFFLSAAVYMFFYTLFFGFVGEATPRYFFPLVPFLAILGAEALQSSKFFVPYAALMVAVHLKLLSFAVLPDTYDVARAFLLTTTGSIATDQPHYFLGIPPTKASIAVPTMEKERFIVSLPEDLPNARPIMLLADAAKADVVVGNTWDMPVLPDSYVHCASIVSAPTKDRMYLWSEVEWSYWWIFQTKRAGPGIEVMCRK